MARTLDISIPTASTSNTSKPYTIYNISLRQPLRRYTVEKRFSDFVELHAAVTSQSNNVLPPRPLPQKSWFKSTVSSPELTESRRRDLEQYLKAINDAKDPRWRSSSAWRIFLNLPNGGAGGLGVARHSNVQSAGAGELRNPITDPSVWLDIHRDLKAQLREARLALNQRDQASNTQAQYEANADAKGCLVKATSTMSSLDAGLQGMSGGEDKQNPSRRHDRNEYQEENAVRLSEGEIHRRKDLLGAARKERDGLQTILSTTAHDRNATTDESNASRDELFRGSVPTGASSGRRKLGAPLKETDRTRELDNTGVLQLQKQIIQEQDEDVVDLTKVVQRMKDMGVQINDELGLQREMLDMLDQDVDRVGDKVNVAKKRIRKIN